MKISANFKQVTALGVKLKRTGMTVHRQLPLLMDDTAEDLLKTVVRNASGRPGPRIITGEYVSRFMVLRPTQHSVRLVNPSPQTRRLEHGFYGTDSAGRVYNQPAFPHMGPAREEVRERFVKNLKEMAMESWRVS